MTKPIPNEQPACDNEIDSGGALAAPAWWQREYGCINEETYQIFDKMHQTVRSIG